MKIGSKNLTFEEIFFACKNNEKIEVSNSILINLQKKRENIEALIKKGNVMYGINTGFGALKTQNVNPQDLASLQENLIVSHSVGVGNPIPENIVKAIMILMVNSLSKGFSGVRPVVVKTLVSMIEKNVIPVVPEKGSVGSSGDLAPSAHIVLVLIGKGEAFYLGKKTGGKQVMEKAKIKPIKLEAKEGLALINNTSTMTSFAISALFLAQIVKNIADISAALSAEALRATNKAFDKRIHNLKPHEGQIKVALNIRDLLKGSTMIDKTRVQDQYSIRCVPQVHGAISDAIEYVKEIVNTEINSVTDNPLIFESGKVTEVISGGNFHGEPVAIAMDFLRLAVCEYANISDRRIASLLDPNHNFGLPAFLAKNPGLNSGMMILQYSTAALVSENKILAHPASVDSIPTSANIEDHVSMGTIAARKTLEVLENVVNVLAIEILVACQAIDFRLKDYKLGKKTAKIYAKVRKNVPFFEKDEEYMPYVSKIVKMIIAGELNLK